MRDVQKQPQEKKDSQYPSSSTEVSNSAGQTVPMDVEKETDLTAPPTEFIEINEQEPGWSTIYSIDQQQQQTGTQPNMSREHVQIFYVHGFIHITCNVMYTCFHL